MCEGVDCIKLVQGSVWWCFVLNTVKTLQIGGEFLDQLTICQLLKNFCMELAITTMQ
jgi:hypothetical protein